MFLIPSIGVLTNTKLLSEDREKVATVRVCVPQSRQDWEKRMELGLEGNE
jgi:hypothetical protein